MRVQFAARVIGQELVEGETPKSAPEAMKIKLAIRPLSQVPGKSSTATLTMPADEALEFPLKRILPISCEEGQGDLFAALTAEDGKQARRRGDPNQGEIGLPRGDSPVAAPGRPATVTRLAPRRGRSAGARGAPVEH
jgi:hypothetical protein